MGEHGEHGKHGRHQPDDRKQYLWPQMKRKLPTRLENMILGQLKMGEHQAKCRAQPSIPCITPLIKCLIISLVFVFVFPIFFVPQRLFLGSGGVPCRTLTPPVPLGTLRAHICHQGAQISIVNILQNLNKK